MTGILIKRGNLDTDKHTRKTLLVQNLRNSQVKSEIGPHTHKARTEQRKRQITADCWVAILKSKGTYLQGLSWIVIS